jgi:hypothetical protein
MRLIWCSGAGAVRTNHNNTKIRIAGGFLSRCCKCFLVLRSVVATSSLVQSFQP